MCVCMNAYSTFYFHKNNLNLIIFSSHFAINIFFLFEVKPKIL